MWTDLICSKFWLSCQLHFFRGMQIVHRIFHLYFHHPVITSAGCLENSETIYSTDNGRNWLVPSRKCTSRNVELIGSFFVRSVFVKRFQCFILCFLGHFVMLSFCGHSEHNTQAIFCHSLIFKTIKFKNGRKT